MVPQHPSTIMLNLFIAAPEGGESQPVLVFVHGSDDYSSGSGNPYDGRVLAGYTNTVVVTINYRLGALGKSPSICVFGL